jgi:hypothetical protein
MITAIIIILFLKVMWMFADGIKYSKTGSKEEDQPRER